MNYQTEFAEKIIDDLKKLLKLKPLESHVKEVKKRGNKIKIGDSVCKLSDFDNEKKRDT